MYCTSCGSKLVEHHTGRFDKETGEPVQGLHCPNRNCEEGCSFLGHDYGRFWIFEGNKCKRCGYEYTDFIDIF